MASSKADPVVVVLQLTGANDYLNTVIPYTNPLYRDNRPNVGIPEDKVLPIDDTLAFHPNMGPVKKFSRAAETSIHSLLCIGTWLKWVSKLPCAV